MDEKELSKKLDLKITKPLFLRIVKYYNRAYAGVHHPSYPMDVFAQHRVLSTLSHLKRLQSLKISKNSKCLDSGCGLGVFLALALKSGYNFYGYEIDEELFGIAKDLLRLNKLPTDHILTYKEFLNLKPGRFDLITSFEVVEHVKDTLSYFQELAKNLSLKGKLFVETPNYIIPYETHFYVFIPPGPRILKWLFIKRAKRTNKNFFDELNFITNKRIEKAMRSAGMQFINLGVDEWMNSIEKPDERRGMHFIHITDFARRFKLLPFLNYLASTGVYTPLVYIASHE